MYLLKQANNRLAYIGIQPYQGIGFRVDIETERQLKIAMLQKGYTLEAAEELLKWYTKAPNQSPE
jgi:hypothetical protein